MTLLGRSARSRSSGKTFANTSVTGNMQKCCLQRQPPGSCCKYMAFEEKELKTNTHSDIAYYGINLNQSIILARIGYASGTTPWKTLYNTAVGNIIIQAAGYLPGFYVGIFLPDRIGRVRQQFWTSIMVCILYAIWAGISTQSAHTPTAGLMTIFALSQFLLTVGPNCTTFLIPAEVFPTRVRGTAHGISAAAGKCGAMLTAFGFGTVEDAIGLEGVLGLFSGIMLLTALVTLLIPETKNYTLEGIENGELYRASEAVAEFPRSNVDPGNRELYVAKTSFADSQAERLSI